MKKIFKIFLILFLFYSNTIAQETVTHKIAFSTAPLDSSNNNYMVCLSSNTTTYFTNTQTAAQMQAIIDAYPKDLNGNTLTFQFYGCKYTNNNYLIFTKFKNGILNIGGVAIAGPSSAQTTIITNSTAATSVFQVTYVDPSCPVTIDSIRCEGSGGAFPILFQRDCGFNTVQNCYLWAGGDTGAGLYVGFLSKVYVLNCGFGSAGSGIYATAGGKVRCNNNSNAGGVEPTIAGHYADTCGFIQRVDATTIKAAADNYTTSGGFLITSAGVTLP